MLVSGVQQSDFIYIYMCVCVYTCVCVYIYIFSLVVYYKIVNVLKIKLKFAQSGLTLCDPMDCTIHGILQARILE